MGQEPVSAAENPGRAARPEAAAQRRFQHTRSLGLVAFVCVAVNWLGPWDAGVQMLFGLFFTLTKWLLVAFWGRRFNS